MRGANERKITLYSRINKTGTPGTQKKLAQPI